MHYDYLKFWVLHLTYQSVLVTDAKSIALPLSMFVGFDPSRDAEAQLICCASIFAFPACCILCNSLASDARSFFGCLVVKGD